MFYLTREQLPFFLPLGFIGVYRWFWFLIRLLAFALYKPLQPRRHPRFKPQRDVTIVVPTIDSGDEIKLALRSWLANDPFEVIFVTIPKAKPAIDALVRDVDPNGNRIRVVTVPRGNKRNQMVKGINHCRTDILVFCDDDVIWPPTMLKWILAPFEDKQMGGVGTSQTVMPLGKTWTIWEILSAFRISMRNIEITATTYIDGGVCCLSGRTAAYRTSILRTQDFQQAFTHEYWRGKYHQHSGDDKFLTRWMHSNDWRTYIQSCPEAELKSTFKDNWRFLLQLLRWTRNTWRSDIRSLFLERKVWTRHPFVAFSMLDKMINPLTLLLGPVMLIYLCTKPQIIPLWVVLTSYFAWLILTRLLKYMPHFVKRPQDILALPVWIVFNIYFAIMKIYCLFTLHVTGWGTRVGAGEEGDAEEGDGGLYIPHWDEEVPGHPYPP
ncbi:nucleotide-diphospho-sugar transferase, partial [Cladochytrium replicatum]